ncbi:hypothetical protein HLH33_05385 [Gluconacetobacter diazotrophicus]|uniref:DUF2946 domain-containing protein n=1 Tax=Gluconacetobacter diazotrophicus TaxID=33996 RepID=A0A7W4FDJ2_GLUDI|nr:DUF2946 family protein [Gluconacetobacter diazotrophicus]MBB2155745.1 hypothetical protein [Gluconacetobacter diazotrophicus]
MTRAALPATRPICGRWLIVALTLIGLLSQLLIQSRALPDEMPRATIERLTGIDIACTMPARPHDDGMAGMRMDGAPQVTPDGHHPAAPDHGDSCPLCPLLHLPVVTLTTLAFLPLPPMVWARPRSHPAQPRAPPVRGCGLPPSRGPPAAA